MDPYILSTIHDYMTTSSQARYIRFLCSVNATGTINLDGATGDAMGNVAKIDIMLD